MTGLSVNEMTTFRWSFEEDVRNYCEAGITAMGVWRQKLADYGEDKGIELLCASGLAFRTCSGPAASPAAIIAPMRRAWSMPARRCNCRARARAGHVIVYSGARNGHTLNHAKRLFTCALSDLLPDAEKLGVTLAIEPMHCGCADAWTFLTTLDCAVSLIEKLESPNLKLAFDTYHLGHDPRVVERIAAIARHIGIVHLGDSTAPPEREQNRRCLGEGNLPLACIVPRLRPPATTATTTSS